MQEVFPQSLARSQQIQQESLKRETEARSAAAALRSKFHTSCQEMGIQVGEHSYVFIHVFQLTF